MNALYSAVAALDHNAMGPAATHSWAEWIGSMKYDRCKLCNSTVSLQHYFCHNCAHGIRPLPCYHRVPLTDATCQGFPPDDLAIEPEMVVFDDGEYRLMKIQCPQCGKRTDGHPRSYFAIDAWNRATMKMQ